MEKNGILICFLSIFCPKCGTPVVQGDGADNRTVQTKKLLLLGGGGVLLAAVLVAGVRM